MNEDGECITSSLSSWWCSPESLQPWRGKHICLRIQWPGNARVNPKHQSHPLFELSEPLCPENRSCSRLVAQFPPFLLAPAESCSRAFQEHLPNPGTLAGDHPVVLILSSSGVLWQFGVLKLLVSSINVLLGCVQAESRFSFYVLWLPMVTGGQRDLTLFRWTILTPRRSCRRKQPVRGFCGPDPGLQMQWPT